MNHHYYYILVTDAPINEGLAYYYYLSFKDIIGEDKISLVHTIYKSKKYNILNRLFNKIIYSIGLNSFSVYKKIKELSQFRNKQKIIIIVFNTALLSHKLIQKLSKKNYILFNYYSDHPYGLSKREKKYFFKTIKIFDSIITFSDQILPILYQYGAKKVIILPFAYCKYTHLNNIKTKFNNNNEIHYFGTWTPIIEEWLIPLKDYNLHIHGNSWNNAKNITLKKIALSSSCAFNNKMIEIANTARIVLNFTRASHLCLHTMKTFELAIAKSCIVSNFSNEQDMYFKKNEDYFYFNTKEELVKCIDLLLNDDKTNQILRDNAFKKAIEHNYHERVKTLIMNIEKINFYEY